MKGNGTSVIDLEQIYQWSSNKEHIGQILFGITYQHLVT